LTKSVNIVNIVNAKLTIIHVGHFAAKSHHNQVGVVEGCAAQPVPRGIASHAKNQQKVLVERIASTP